MMTLNPREQPEHSDWRETLAEVVDLVQDRNDLLRILEAAIPYEREQREKLERAEAEVERLELEVGGLRRQLQDVEAELRVRHDDQLGRSTLRWAGQWWAPAAGGGA